jgi:hypothetical protein
MSANLWQVFQSMIPKTPLMIVNVVSHNADGTSTVATPDGSEFKVIGTGVAIAGAAYIKGGNIIGEAPKLTVRAEQTI